MPIVVTCECGKQFQAREENAGRLARCPDCGRELVIPKVSAGPDDAPVFIDEGEARTSGKAIASLILGLLSFVCFIFTGLPAVILGALGLSDISRSHGRVRGKGMAISGIVLGGLSSFMVIPAILIALLLPAVQAAREAARRAQCTNNLKRIGLAFHNFADSEGHLPPAAITDENGKPLLSWRVALLPYLEVGDLYKEFKLDEPWDSPHNMALVARMPKVFECPSDPNSVSKHATGYQVVVGPNTLFEGDRGITLRAITDGTSNTLLVAETKNLVPWTKPDDIPAAEVTSAVGSNHAGGANILMADGSVRFLRKSQGLAVLQALITRNGGEVISADAF